MKNWLDLSKIIFWIAVGLIGFVFLLPPTRREYYTGTPGKTLGDGRYPVTMSKKVDRGLPIFLLESNEIGYGKLITECAFITFAAGISIFGIETHRKKKPSTD